MENSAYSPAQSAIIYNYFIESGVVKDEAGEIKNKENFFYVCRVCLEKKRVDKNGKPRETNCIRGTNSNLNKHIRTPGHEEAQAEIKIVEQKNLNIGSASKRRKLDYTPSSPRLEDFGAIEPKAKFPRNGIIQK